MKLDEKTIVRDLHRIIWTQSYDRGLEHLLKMWPDIKLIVPPATLHVFYGWQLFDRFYKDNPGSMMWRDQMAKMLLQDGVTDYGRRSQKELIEEYQKSGVWAYPTHFGEINCHPKGVFIQTKKGDIKIEDLKITDEVLTHTNSYQKITAIRNKNYSGMMFTLTPQCGESFKATSEHPVYTIPLSKSALSEAWSKKIMGKPEWRTIDKIREGDILLYPRLKKQKRIDMSPELAWWYGYFAGDGNANLRGRISCLVAEAHKERDLDRVRRGFNELGLTIAKERLLPGCVQLEAYSHPIAKQLRKQFYTAEGLKTIPYDIYTSFPEEVMDGLLASDGSIWRGYDKGINFTFTNRSRLLISTFRQLLSYKGIAAKVKTRIHVNNNISYSLSWREYDGSYQNFYYKDDDFIYLRVKKVEAEEFTNEVFNIDVAWDHSYLANGIIVHNCISAIKAQAYGCEPVIVNYAALKETVQWGRKVEGDIYDQETQDAFQEQLVEALKNPMSEEKRQEMMAWARKKYAWKVIASQWDKEFRR